jgi:hypothetical protein
MSVRLGSRLDQVLWEFRGDLGCVVVNGAFSKAEEGCGAK